MTYDGGFHIWSQADLADGQSACGKSLTDAGRWFRLSEYAAMDGHAGHWCTQCKNLADKRLEGGKHDRPRHPRGRTAGHTRNTSP